MNLIKLACAYKDTAKRHLSTDKYLQAIVFIITEKERFVVPAQYETDEEKYKFYNAVCNLGRSKNAIGAISVSEGWTSKDISCSKPSEADDKQECILVSLSSRNINHGWLIPFERKADEIVFGEEMETRGELTMKDNLIGDMFSYDA